MCQLVDWSAGKLLPAPRKDRPDRREMHYPVRCVRCGNTRWLTRHDGRKAEAEQRICRVCQTSFAGKLGYAATVAAYGSDFALNAVRAYQLKKPSSYEIIVESWLKELGVQYTTQVIFKATDDAGIKHSFILDFKIQTATGPLAVEVNGYHHQKYRLERDYWLKELYPHEIIFITTNDIDEQPEEVKTMLRQTIQWSHLRRKNSYPAETPGFSFQEEKIYV